jgi:hypothetical protein
MPNPTDARLAEARELKIFVAICQRCSNIVACECIDHESCYDSKDAAEFGRMVHRAILRGNRIGVETQPVTVGQCQCWSALNAGEEGK